MDKALNYRRAFWISVAIHSVFFLLLVLDWPAIKPQNLALEKNGLPQPLLKTAGPEPIKAVSVDSEEVQRTMSQLQNERRQAAHQAAQEKRNLELAAEQARQTRLKEQQHLAQLKIEAQRVAEQRKRQLQEEEKQLKALALKKAEEHKELEALALKQAALKKQAQEEREHLALLQKKQEEDKKREAEKKALEAKKLAEEKAQQRAEQARQEALAAEKKAKILSEVDKYKSLIVAAIGQQWILPESVDKQLSSQFRMRLAPSGEVLELSLIRSSGDAVLDRSAENAIYKASPLPVPGNHEVFDLFREITLTVRPESARG